MIAAALLVASAGCSAGETDAKSEPKSVPEAKSEPEAKPEANVEQPPKADLADGSLVTPYLALADRLAADRPEGLRDVAAALEQATASRLTAPGVEEVKAAAAKISNGDIESARVAFRELSHALLRYLDHDTAAREGLTLVYCPMAFDNTGGYWVQRGTQIRNPYEGSRMLDCGAVLEWDEGVAHRERWAQAQAQP